MEIIDIDMYLDGGTIIIQTDEGEYCVDDRILSTTKHKIYNGYPLDDESNIVNIQEDIIDKLKKSCYNKKSIA